MDLGVIWTLEHHFRGLVVGNHLHAIDKSEVITITLLDALIFLRQAWHNITQQSIANCYARAGLKIIDLASQSIDDEDQLDDIPLARLIGINITMNEYVAGCTVLTEIGAKGL